MKCNYQFQNVPDSGIIAYPEGNMLRVFFDITPAQTAPIESEDESSEEAEIPQTYDCIQVDVYGRSYSDIVSAIVRDKYSNDDVQAIIANYTESMNEASAIISEKREEYLAEYADYQAWRKHAKEVANMVLDTIAD